VDPVRDIEIITTELVLADLEAVQKRLASVAKDAKRGDKEALAQEAVLKKIEPHLNAGKPALTLELTPEEKAISRLFWLLTDKPTIFACNVKESRPGHRRPKRLCPEGARICPAPFCLRSGRHQRAD
jgi:ribosome-binding ATPase YchF (GTP1/OBG family)